MRINCEYSNPVDNQGNTPSIRALPFQFKNSVCEVIEDDISEPALITNKFSQGEVMISFLIFLGLLLGLTSFLINNLMGLKFKRISK